MKTEILSNGNLKIIASPIERKALKRRGKTENWFNASTSENWFIENFMEPLGFENLEGQVALCSAPVIGKNGEAWGFMNYCIEAFLETMATKGETVWQKG